MKTEDQILADYAELPTLYGLVYVLLKSKVKDEAVFTLPALQDLLEQHLAVKLPYEAIRVGVEAGIERNIFRLISGQGRSPRYEVSRKHLIALFEYARVRKQSLIYRILKIGEGQFKEEVDYLKERVREELEFQKVTNYHSSAGASIYSMRFLAELTGPANAKKIPLIYADSTREVDWTKWGSVAAIIGLPIAILAILVAVWLDKN